MIDIKHNYHNSITKLHEELGVSNVMAMPQLRSVTLNIGVGQHRGNKDMMAYISNSLAKITGQKPVITKAKKAIAGFKLRAGDEVGIRVTLRGQRMYDFLNRLINISLPRIRDFKGINTKSFDSQGNLTLGFKDQVAFAEIGHEGMDKPFGVAVTISIAHSDPQKSVTLLQQLGFPVKVA